MAAIDLNVDDLVERVALRVVELLREPAAPVNRMIGVAELAELLAVSRDTIYRHAEALGVVRVGGALRFDPATAREAWTSRCASTPSLEPAAPATTRNRPGRPRRNAGTTGDLLPIRGQIRGQVVS